MNVRTRPVADVLWDAWQTVLGKPPASGDQNFFVAGGHSLAGVRFMELVEKELAIEFPLESLFNATLTELVEECTVRVPEEG